MISVSGLGFGLAGCSHSPDKPATREEMEGEQSLKKDREDIAELRKDIPEETKKSNDRLADVLLRWKQHKMDPSELREKYDDEIRKNRADFEKRIGRKRDDFNHHTAEKRKSFQDKQKEDRDDFLSGKYSSEKRSSYLENQSVERDRFNTDLRDERDEFEDVVREERKTFENDIANRRTEFKQEFPEYQKIYSEMKAAGDKAKDERRENPVPYNGWPYKTEGAPTGSSNRPALPEQTDVNKGGDGWPASDPSELNQVATPSKQGH